MIQINHIVLLIALVVSTTAIGQANLDSLWNIWEDETQHDTTRLKALNEYAWKGYLYSRPDSAYYFAQLRYDHAEKSGLKEHMSGALTLQGATFYIRGAYSKALDYYQRSLKISEEIGDKTGIAVILNNIGLIYHFRSEYSKALEMYQRSLEIEEEKGDRNGIARTLNNMGTIYIDQGDNPKALAQFQRSLKIWEEIGNKYGVTTCLANIGKIYQDEGDYYRALDNFQKSLKVAEEIGDKSGIVYSLNCIGKFYNKEGDFQQATNYCSRGLQMAKEIGAVTPQRTACQCLYNAYKTSGNGNKALEYHEQMLVLDDSLNAEETAKQLERMEFAKAMLADSLRQQEEKLIVEMAHQQEVARKEKTRNWAIAGGGLLLILAIGLYGRNRYVRKAKAQVEKEKDRSEDLLLNILPAEIAEELKEKGEAAARDFDMVSILFTDFKGFTQASEQLSAADLVAEINTCFKAFDGIVGKYNIEKIKTIGDAYMCAGGLPVPDENAAKNTVLAGLEMQAFMKARKLERDVAGLPAFEMRVGIHTGPVVAGIVGVKKFQYDIWGDTVNTASRMESSGEVGQVNISEATYELVKDLSEFDFTARGKIEAKGKGELEMYFVIKNNSK